MRGTGGKRKEREEQERIRRDSTPHRNHGEALRRRGRERERLQQLIKCQNCSFTDTENSRRVLPPGGDGVTIDPIRTRPAARRRGLGVAADWLERPQKAQRAWQRARSPRASKTFQQCSRSHRRLRPKGAFFFFVFLFLSESRARTHSVSRGRARIHQNTHFLSHRREEKQVCRLTKPF